MVNKQQQYQSKYCNREMNSSVFNLDENSESMKVEDLHLMNREKLETVPEVQRVYVGEFQEIKKPFLEQIKPHLATLLAGAASTAETAGSYGLKALSALSGAFWWGFKGIKGIFSKTAQYIQPKFVLITSKTQNKQQIDTIEKVSKEVAVLGVDEYQQMPEMMDGRLQLAMPVDEEFLEFLRRQKVEVNKPAWEPRMETTKTLIAPSESFSEIFQSMKSQKIPLKFNNFGGFCTFELEGKNEIEYECIQKLRLGENMIEGYLMPVPERVNSVKSEESGPDVDPEAALIASRQMEKKELELQSVPAVKSVEGINLYPEEFSSSENMKLQFA